MTDILKRYFNIDAVKKMLFSKTVGTAAFFGEAVFCGMELYDVYAADRDKTGLIAAAAARCDDRLLKDALRIAADEINVSCEGADEYFFGSRQDFKRRGIAIPEAVSRTDFSKYSVLFASRDGEFAGFLLFREKILSLAKSAVEFLKDNKIKTVIIGKEKSLENIASRLCANESRRAILKIEREKVLQELRKSDKIVVIESADDIEKCINDVFFEKKLHSVKLLGIICTAAVAVSCAFLAFLPWLVLLAAANTAAFIFYSSVSVRQAALCLPDITEEEKMFGKVNYTMHIGGMSCAHCSARVKSTLESIRGVSASVSLEEKVARIKCPASLDANKLSEAVSGAGFTVVSVEKV